MDDMEYSLLLPWLSNSPLSENILFVLKSYQKKEILMLHPNSDTRGITRIRIQHDWGRVGHNGKITPRINGLYTKMISKFVNFVKKFVINMINKLKGHFSSIFEKHLITVLWSPYISIGGFWIHTVYIPNSWRRYSPPGKLPSCLSPCEEWW